MIRGHRATLLGSAVLPAPGVPDQPLATPQKGACLGHHSETAA